MPNLIRRVFLRALTQRPATIDNRKPARSNLGFETLEDRTVPATFTVDAFSVTGGTQSAANNDYTRINNAIQALAADDVLQLNGAFDWTNTFARASWAKGDDGVAGTDDDYSIYIQPGIDHVTITALNAPVNGTYSASIKGPGDVAGVDAEAFLYFGYGEGLTNKNWTISNLQIEGFDGAIEMYNFDDSADTYSGTTITNNKIIVPADRAGDESGNVGILLGFGTGQTVSNNTILLAGSGTSSATALAYSVGIETQPGAAGNAYYNNLAVTGNTIQVTGAQSATPEVVIGVWENGNATGSNITVSGNSFTNTAAGNNRNTNLQRGFRISSQSTATTAVLYSNNTVSGANIGLQWQPLDYGADLSGGLPVQLVGNTLTGNQTGVEVGSGGSAYLARNVITGNATGVRVVDGSLAAAGAAPAAVEHNTITGNTTGISVLAVAGAIGPISNNDLSGNTKLAVSVATNATVDAGANWWGSTLPLTIASKHTSNVTDGNFLSAQPQPAFTSNASATFSTTGANPVIPNTFTVATTASPTATLSTAGTLPAGLVFTPNGGGTATITGTPTVARGAYTFTVVADDGVNAVSTQTFTVNVVTPPVITSAASTTFEIGESASFTVTFTAGAPAATTLSVSGTLPAGVTFNPTSGKFTGTPGANTGGVYVVTVTASNGPGSSTSQVFTLNVQGTPRFTSAATAKFVLGVPGSLTVTTDAFPTVNAIALNNPGGLPAGVTFADNGDGTATITYDGTGTTASASLSLTAANGTTNRTQNTAVVIGSAPTLTVKNGDTPINDGDTVTIRIGDPVPVTATVVDGFPTPTTRTLSGALPANVTFNTATGTFSGKPAAGTGGDYTITITASNSVTSTSLTFTLKVDGGPTITSAGSATFVTGFSNATYTVTATGSPAPAITLAPASNPLPDGLTLFDNGDGTATISGTPTVSGTFTVKILATNSFGSVQKSLTVAVNAPAQITSDNTATFTVGTAGPKFTVTTSGFPAPTVTLTGTLPSGVTFANGAFTGTPAPGTGGVYTVALTASNGVGSTATQSFTLTVNQAPGVPVFTVPTLTVGVPMAPIMVPLKGYPTPTIDTGSSVLPPGLSLALGTDADGNPVVVISGTPTGSSGSGKTVTIAVTNVAGTKTRTSNSFNINETPTFVNGATDAATFTTTQPASTAYTIQTTGFPTAKVTLAAGSLPPGVSLNAANQLIGRPTASGVFTFTLTATNAAGSVQQAFTLTVNAPPSVPAFTIPTLTVGTPMTPVTVTIGGYPAPDAGSVAASLPPGLSLAVGVDGNGNATATISGTPTGPGGTGNTILIAATNAYGSSTGTSKAFTINQPVAFTSAGSLTVASGVPMATSAPTFALAATGFPAPTVFKLNGLTGTALATGVPGVTFNTNTRTFSGAPTTPGTYTLTFTATNANNETATQTFTLLVVASPVVVTTSLPNWTQNVAYSQAITAAGGTGAVTWSLDGGTLPTGLTLDPATGVLSGTPSVADTFIFTVTATDTILGTGSQTYIVTINPPVAIVTPPASLAWTINAAGFAQFTGVTGGTGPIKYSSTALPAGLKINPSTGVISGTPTAVGFTAVTVTATDAAGATSSVVYTVTVNKGMTIATGSTLPNGRKGVGYGQTISVTGGTGDKSFEIIAGALPQGLFLNPTTGVITGTPTKAGKVDITVRVTDAAGATVKKVFQFTVKA